MSEEFTLVSIESVKVGDYVCLQRKGQPYRKASNTFRENGKTFYVLMSTEDINACRFIKKGTMVYIGFTYQSGEHIAPEPPAPCPLDMFYPDWESFVRDCFLCGYCPEELIGSEYLPVPRYGVVARAVINWEVAAEYGL